MLRCAQPLGIAASHGSGWLRPAFSRSITSRIHYNDPVSRQRLARRMIEQDEDFANTKGVFKFAQTAMENEDTFENGPRAMKSVEDNRFIRYIMRAMQSCSHQPTQEEFRHAAERAHVGRRIPGEEGRDFDAEDVLELLHDPNLFTEDDWRDFRQFMDTEIVPLLRNMDALDLFLDPRVYREWEKNGPSWGPAYRPYHHWQILREERRETAAPPPESLQEMVALHVADPLRWPYERLAATFGYSVDAVKYYLLQEYCRTARATGQPFKYDEAAARLFKREYKELEKTATRNLKEELETSVQDPKLSKNKRKQLLQRARHLKQRRFMCGFYSDSRLWKAVLEAQKAEEPSINDLLTKVEPLGPDPEYVAAGDIEDKAPKQPAAKTPAAELPSWAGTKVGKRRTNLSIAPYDSEAHKREGVYFTVKDKKLQKDLHLVREPSGALRHATLEERELAAKDYRPPRSKDDAIIQFIRKRYMHWMLRKLKDMDNMQL
eukprot:TRINITY_DN71195_c0_g1_i1.p1 TRINITY_DN71195_c0_g1~~TRINITY_DN71195_c0_g1_i1.p1  ORF type:complete len:491 (+),score=85.74 TRINITY_DN71195_c0_g1_i1:25-1497(+)